jgi:hypothetical protein
MTDDVRTWDNVKYFEIVDLHFVLHFCGGEWVLRYPSSRFIVSVIVQHVTGMVVCTSLYFTEPMYLTLCSLDCTLHSGRNTARDGPAWDVSRSANAKFLGTTSRRGRETGRTTSDERSRRCRLNHFVLGSGFTFRSCTELCQVLITFRLVLAINPTIDRVACLCVRRPPTR